MRGRSKAPRGKRVARIEGLSIAEFMARQAADASPRDVLPAAPLPEDRKDRNA